MALWDDFGKKAGDAVRNVGNRARVIAESTKLNGQIAVRKTEVERLYAEIGKAYCDARKADGTVDEKTESLCAQVEEINADIARLQELTDSVRQVCRCKNCGDVSPLGTRFCPGCGARLAESEPAATKAAEQEPTAAPEDEVEITWPESTPAAPVETNEPVKPTETIEPTEDSETGEPTEESETGEPTEDSETIEPSEDSDK